MKQYIFLGLILIMVIILLGLMAIAAYGILVKPQTASSAPSPVAKLTFVVATNTPTSHPTATQRAIQRTPSLSVLPVQGETNLLISVTGQNWQPGDTLLVQIDATSAASVLAPLQKEVRVTSDGAFLAAFILAADSDWARLSEVKITAESLAVGDYLTTDFITGGLYPPTATATATQTETPTPIPTATTSPAQTPLPPPTPTPFSIVTQLSQFPIQLEPRSASTLPVTQYRSLPGEWLGEYYANPELSGLPLLVRSEPGLNFDWGESSPALEIPVDGFSARWSRPTEFAPGRYRFSLTVAGGARLWANGQLLIDTWQDDGLREIVRDYIASGGLSQITVEYNNRRGEARIRYGWEAVDPTPTPPQLQANAGTANLTNAVSASRADLARRTGLRPDEIQVLSVTPMTWQNSNLACTAVQPGFQVIIPGYLIFLEADQIQYEYHTDGGSYILLCHMSPTVSNRPTTPIPQATPNTTP